MHLKLDLVLQFGRFPGAAAHRAILRKARVASWIECALKHPAEIAVRIVGEDEARMLNFQYRQRDHATNVLTFDYAREPWVSAD
ncbi:MAG: rRNA maturation RNAse YbeY, partial [Ramlibacter sp.]